MKASVALEPFPGKIYLLMKRLNKIVDRVDFIMTRSPEQYSNEFNMEKKLKKEAITKVVFLVFGEKQDFQPKTKWVFWYRWKT